MVFRISFTLVLTVLTLILSLVPAIVIWVVFMDLLTSSVDLLKGTTQESTDTMAAEIQEQLMTEAVNNFDTLLTEGENEASVYRSMVMAIGLPNRDLHPDSFDAVDELLVPYRAYPFSTMKGHSLFSTLALSGAIFPGNSTVGPRAFMLGYSALYLDVATNVVGNRTLYLATMALTPDARYIRYNSTYVDQDTGVPLIFLTKTVIPSASVTMTYLPDGWDNQLSFNSYSGQVELTRWEWLRAQNNTMVQVSLAVTAETLSTELADQLSGSPDDRLVLFFRQPDGYMIAASHGKYWSDSDVNRQDINPLTNPPNISAYRLWNCMQSNDALISQACQQLYATYRNWSAIPVLRQEAVLSGQLYWVATGFSSDSIALQATVLMLKNRASVMGGIDASNAEVDQNLANRKTITFVILGVISALAVLLPVAVGLWLASRLYSLAAGMDGIAKLQFDGISAKPTMFQELHRFQTSFIQMERGLKAFGKFVPQAVVRVLIAGQMKANDQMNPETLTIMFADIEGFSTVCENVLPSVLVTVCTEYFETMCSNIVQCHGTVDKFIGDCIMAMWNVPDRLLGHERDAVATALAMQSSVLQLRPSWQQRGLPLLKFRVGIHTGVCLVGNFGCSYRVSYTCLGDGVNLSARLEALNKKFGTYICVSHATYHGCQDDFHFRCLGKVTVPGRAEVLPVYEVLCPRDPADPLKPGSPTVAHTPGAVLEVAGPAVTSPTGSLHSGGAYLRFTSGSSQLKGTLPAGTVPYHWGYVDETALLEQSQEYEAAYEAAVAGNHGEARQLLMAKALYGAPDKAWAALADQLERSEGGKPWDGVFYFREK